MKRLLHSSLSASFLTFLVIACSHLSQAQVTRSSLLAQTQACPTGVSPEYCQCAAQAENTYNDQVAALPQDAKEPEQWRVWREYTVNLKQCHQFLAPQEREVVYMDECLNQFRDLPNPQQYCSCQVSLDLDVENTFRQVNVAISPEQFQEFGRREFICSSYLYSKPQP